MKPRVDWMTEEHILTAVARILLGSSYHRALRIFSRFLLAVDGTLFATLRGADFGRDRDEKMVSRSLFGLAAPKINVN
jgi:hypothetical protein